MRSILFQTDFMGTITALIEDEYHKKELARLIDYLIEIKNNNKADKIIFSISTYDNSYSSVEWYVKNIKEYVKDREDFEFGTIFLEKKYYIYSKEAGKYLYSENNDDGSKAEKFSKYIDQLNDGGHDLQWIGFADDNYGYNILNTLKKNDIQVPYNVFIPGAANCQLVDERVFENKEDGILGLNNSIASYLKKPLIDYNSLYNLRGNAEKKIVTVIEVPKEVIPIHKLERVPTAFELEMKAKFEENSLSRDEISKIKKRVEEIKNFKENNNWKAYDLLQRELWALESILEDLFRSGYFNKYSQRDVENIKYSSSMLAISLLDNPSSIRALPRNRYMRLCRMHTEKTPSLMVYEDNSSYCCYGCRNAGSIYQYLMRCYQMDFVSVVETLAKAFNIELPQRRKTKEDVELVKRIIEIYNGNMFADLIAESQEKTPYPIAEEKQLVYKRRMSYYDKSNNNINNDEYYSGDYIPLEDEELPF